GTCRQPPFGAAAVSRQRADHRPVAGPGRLHGRQSRGGGDERGEEPAGHGCRSAHCFVPSISERHPRVGDAEGGDPTNRRRRISCGYPWESSPSSGVSCASSSDGRPRVRGAIVSSFYSWPCADISTSLACWSLFLLLRDGLPCGCPSYSSCRRLQSMSWDPFSSL